MKLDYKKQYFQFIWKLGEKSFRYANGIYAKRRRIEQAVAMRS